MNNTAIKNTISGLIAVGYDADEALALATAKIAPVKADGRNLTARKINHDRRIARRDANPGNAAGLKRALRRDMAAILRAELGREFTQAEWDANAAAWKAGEFEIEGWEREA